MAPIVHAGTQLTYVRRITSYGAAVLAVSGLWLTGCSSAGKSHTPSAPAQHTSTANDPSLSPAGRAAQGVQATLLPQLNAHEEHFGSGTNSACSTSQSSVFTSACADIATVVEQDANQALTAVSGKSGFATLRSVAKRLQQAVGEYNALGCAHDPSNYSVRHRCLEPAAQIAQGDNDLRDGVNMGLAGR